MTSPAPRTPDSRSAAIGDLFSALEALMISYQALPEAERARQCATDADRITGEVAWYLNAARARISATFRAPLSS